MSNDKTKYSTEKLKKFEAIIKKQLDTVTEELANIQTDQKNQKEHIANTNTDFNGNSKHFQQQAKNKRHIRRLKKRERELNDALKRIDDGTYGISERSGKLIREERLMVMPTARFDISRKLRKN